MWKVSFLLLSTLLISGCDNPLDGKQVEELQQRCKDTKATTWKIVPSKVIINSASDVMCIYIDNETDTVYEKRASSIKIK